MAGFDPQGGLFLPLEFLIQTNIPDIYVLTTGALILLIILVLAVRKAYAIGGPAAIIAVAMGFLAGLATPTDLIVGPAMLLLAIISAYVSIAGWRALKRPEA
jgi:hypothetical protein